MEIDMNIITLLDPNQEGFVLFQDKIRKVEVQEVRVCGSFGWSNESLRNQIKLEVFYNVKEPYGDGSFSVPESHIAATKEQLLQKL